MPGKGERVKPIAEQILRLNPEESLKQLRTILAQYSHRHRNITKILLRNFEKALGHGNSGFAPEVFTEQQKLILGAYFTMEYSIESTALFNPSMVAAPDQAGVLAGEKKVIVSFRAVGEGHISSLVFREGILDKENNLTLLANRNHIVDMPERIAHYVYEKTKFIQKMREMALPDKICALANDLLKETFILEDLSDCLEPYTSNNYLDAHEKTLLPQVIWLAKSHYEVTFSLDTALAERVLFPVTHRESNGIEDVRLMQLVNDLGESTYYGTYTAYNGVSILPKIIETKDFYTFKISPVHGPHVLNKGLAFFPRKINGRYAMLAHIDGVNNYIMYSDDIYVWPGEAILLQKPEQAWELMQVGNSGSPIETPQGWLVITHSVGAMRQYSLGAILLDLNNPEKIIGRLKEPLLLPNEEEREGYVPNVVYSCGSMIHGDDLIIPYGMSDYCSSYITVPLKVLMLALTQP